MVRFVKWLCIALIALVLLLVIVLSGVALWLRGDGPRAQLQASLQARLGVAVQIEGLSLDVWPSPAVGVQGLRIATEPPLSIGQASLEPSWRALIAPDPADPRGRLVITQLSVRDARLPQRGIDALLRAVETSQGKTRGSAAHASPATSPVSGRAPAAAPGPSPAAATMPVLALLPERMILERIDWVSSAGDALRLSLQTRRTGGDQLDVLLRVAGGRVEGPLRLSATGSAQAARVLLRGELRSSGLDLNQLPMVNKRLSGILNATTTLEAQAREVSGLDTALQTRTELQVGGALLKGVDLAKAVRTLGLSREGQTPLDSLSGVVTTRATGAAMTLQLSNLQARSGVLQARGAVSVGAAGASGARALSGRVDVDLNPGGQVGGAVAQLAGIPLEISGTTASPEVRPTKGALIGGTIGSIFAPGAGTAAGAKMGDKAMNQLGSIKERLFGK